MNNKAVKKKKCNKCKKPFMPYSRFEKYCIPCAIKIGRSDRTKMERKEIKIKNTERQDKKRIFKENDLRHQLKLTQTVFNRLRVLQEKQWFKEKRLVPRCISCGKKNMDWCCGHFKTVGAQGNLRYDPMNTYLQCNWNCNKNRSGNIEGDKNTRGYKQGLRERFGEEEGNNIIEYCEINTEVKKWTGVELKAMRKEFSRQIREIEKSIGE